MLNVQKSSPKVMTSVFKWKSIVDELYEHALIVNLYYCTLDTTTMDKEQPQDQSSIDTLSGTCTLIEILLCT